MCEEPRLALGYGFLASCTTITEGDYVITAAGLIKAWKNGGQKFTKVTFSKVNAQSDSYDSVPVPAQKFTNPNHSHKCHSLK